MFNSCINDIEYNIFYTVHIVWTVQLVKNVFFRNFKVVCGWRGLGGGGGCKTTDFGDFKFVIVEAPSHYYCMYI